MNYNLLVFNKNMKSRISEFRMMLIVTLLMVCLYMGDGYKFSFQSSLPVRTILHGRSTSRQTILDELNARRLSESLYYNRDVSELKKKEINSYSCDLKIKPATKAVASTTSCYFEKSSPCSSCRSGICPVDNRPCEANRDYMDHIYGARYMPKPKPVFQAYRYSQQSQMHMYAAKPSPPQPEKKFTVAEKRTKRQKLFLMSTWLEDLIPNPAQGRSWMFNSLCDTLTIVTTIGKFIISFFMMLISPATQSFSIKERNQNSDSTSQ